MFTVKYYIVRKFQQTKTHTRTRHTLSSKSLVNRYEIPRNFVREGYNIITRSARKSRGTTASETI
jgi:hypothetical protein